MNTPLRLTLITFAAAAGLGIATYAYTVSKYEKAFSAATDDETRGAVLERFGSPSMRESRGTPFMRYATASCVAPCYERLWWENPILKGIEAWSVEFNPDGKVIHKAHWVSP
jgi:hypothetical protein